MTITDTDTLGKIFVPPQDPDGLTEQCPRCDGVGIVCRGGKRLRCGGCYGDGYVSVARLKKINEAMEA